MAVARTHTLSSDILTILTILTMMILLVKGMRANILYSRQYVLQICTDCTEHYFNSKTIPQEILRQPGLTWIPTPEGRRRRRRWERKQTWGKRAGLLACLRVAPYKTPLPSVFLANARSLTNKMDELRLSIVHRDLQRTAVF